MATRCRSGFAADGYILLLYRLGREGGVARQQNCEASLFLEYANVGVRAPTDIKIT